MNADENGVARRYLAPWQLASTIQARSPDRLAAVRSALVSGYQGGGAGDARLAWQTRPDGIGWGTSFHEAFFEPQIIRWRDLFATIHATADVHPDVTAELLQVVAWDNDHQYRHAGCPFQAWDDLQANELDLGPIYERHYGEAWMDTAVRLGTRCIAARRAFWDAALADAAAPSDLFDLLDVS